MATSMLFGDPVLWLPTRPRGGNRAADRKNQLERGQKISRVLSLTLPKVEEAKPRRIEVKGGDVL
jgi:hypothetical protein